MCLAIPGKIIMIKGDAALVDYRTEKREARLLDENFGIGDYVIVSNKIVVDKIPERQALEAIEAWKQALKTEKE